MRAAFALFVISILSVVGLAPVASAHPTATVVVYWEGAHAPGLNTACPEGAKSQFIVRLRVQKGEQIVSFANFKLHMKSGTDKYANGTRVSQRLVEFYVMAGRRAQPDSTHPRKSYAYPVELSEGADPRIRIIRTCVGVVA